MVVGATAHGGWGGYSFVVTYDLAVAELCGDLAVAEL